MTESHQTDQQPVPTDAAPVRVSVISGPTAVGKGTVVARLKQLHPEVYVSVSATTRAPRPGEVDGVHYVFGSHLQVAKSDDLVAWEQVAEGVNDANPIFATSPRSLRRPSTGPSPTPSGPRT